MKQSFGRKLEQIAENYSGDLRHLALKSVRSVISAGVNSFETLMGIVDHPDLEAEIRADACWVLGQLRNKKAVNSLLAAFHDDSALVMWEAAKAIGIIESERAVRPLIAELEGADNIDRRCAAAHALGSLRDERAVQPLVRSLRDSTADPKVRAFAAEALGYLHSTRAVQPLVTALEDASVEVRFWAAFALGAIGDRKALPALRKAAATDTAFLQGWGPVSNEATLAIQQIMNAE